MFRIMIAEDEPLILQSICEKIRLIDPDFKIVGAYENGEYAMLELDLVKPHVVLTDIYMPVMDGLSLIEHVNRHSPSTFCVVLTGYRDFEYARKAIQVGVSDYLLKPPTVDILSKFLKEVKAKLWKNQSLVQTELLQQWAFHKDEDRDSSSELERVAQEYFYHASYVVIYGWTPPQLQSTLLGTVEQWNMDDILNDGEKAYLIPTNSSNQKIFVVGVHSLPELRLRQLADHAIFIMSEEPLCVAVATIGKLQKELYPIISKLHKKVHSGFPLDGSRGVILQDTESHYEVPTLPIPEALEQELSALLVKQRKTEFARKLEVLLQADAWTSGTRVQWLQTLSYLMNSWILQYPELAKRSLELNWFDELEEVIWQARHAEAMILSLKELHNALFDNFEREAEIEASWLEALKAYLDTRYMDNISLTELAERFGLNASYLGRVFKRKYGQSPIDFLIQLRITKAKQLISEKPRLLFKDVAELVGYNDPFYFSKLFKQWTGQTPREFKKHPRGE
jgi:two-component system response regulator YesN